MTLQEPLTPRGFQYKHGDRPLDGYTIQRAAGRGGFGEVYQAVSDSGREVALKLVHTYEQIELRGISQCMNLKSPHLVTIFDVKYGNDGRPWVIMEFVSGPSLRDLLDAAPSGLGVAKAAFFLREIGKGLTYLHDCGIVHRDLKPGNIFYENGYVKIGDYGLSKAMSLTRHSGQTVAVGTLHYMAPEIGEGRYDRSIDIYAMGALLYEMLTGQVPFFGSSPAEVLMKHLTVDVNLDGIEEPLKSVVRKAMAKNPADRYQSVQEMVEAVYGSDEIRNSVTQFSPESLTMVAGRVARNVGSGGSNPAEEWQRAGRDWQEWGQRMHQMPKMERLRFAAKWRRGWQGKGTVASGEPDPIAWPGRIFLALATAGLAAFIAGSTAGRSPNFADEQAWMTFASILGAVAGAILSWRYISPGLAGESHWFRRVAIGAPAAMGAMLLAFLVVATSVREPRNIAHAMLASFLGLLVLDWSKRLSPNRKDRLSIGLMITSAIAALIFCGVFDLNDDTSPVVFATVIGASVAASLLASKSPHRVVDKNPPEATPFPVGGPMPPASAMPPMPPIPPIPPIPPRPAAAPAVSPFGVAFGNRKRERRNAGWIVFCVIFAMFVLGMFRAPGNRGGMGRPSWGISFMPIAALVIVFMVIRRGMASKQTPVAAPVPPSQFSSRGAEMAMGIGRWFLSLMGSILLFTSLVLAFAAMVNLPGVLVAVHHNLRYVPSADNGFLDVAARSHWPALILKLAGAAAFVLGFLGIMLLILARKSRGWGHMLRAIVGAGCFYLAIALFDKARPDWSGFGISGPFDETFARFIDQTQLGVVVVAAILAMTGAMLLMWPAKRRSIAQVAQAASPGAATKV